MARSRPDGIPNETITLTVSFYNNGILFDPFSVSDVTIYTAKTGGVLLDTITPTSATTGIYTADWLVPSDLGTGTYFDRWDWTAASGISSQLRVYNFTVTADSFNPRPKTIPLEGPLFVGHKEIDFFNSITKETIQKIISQKIIYYAVSEEKTNTHRLYNESIQKQFHRPVVVNALVLYNEPNQTIGQFSIDTIYSIEVYFHIHELEERNLIPREGDFVKFGKILYEIEKLNKPQIVYGQVKQPVMIKSICRVARKSQVEILDGFEGA